MITITDGIFIAIIATAILIMAIVTLGHQCKQQRPKFVVSEQEIPRENMTWNSALPKIQLSTFPADFQSPMYNTMTMIY
jgi:hypothetical protein